MPRDLSDEDLDQLLAADQHLAAALELAEPLWLWGGGRWVVE